MSDEVFFDDLHTIEADMILADESEEEYETTKSLPSVVKKIQKLANKYKLLTPAEEVVLARKWKAEKDTKARDELCFRNIRLVIKFAHRWVNKGLDLEDLYQEAFIALLKAIDKYDPDRGFRFATYACWWLRQGVSRAVANTGRTIRVPIHEQNDVRKVLSVYSQLRHSLQTRPTVKDLAEATGFSVEKIERLAKIRQSVVSLDETLTGDQEGTTRLNMEVSLWRGPEDLTEDRQDLEHCQALIDMLPDPKDRQLLRFYYGYYDSGAKKDSHEFIEYANMDPIEAQKRIKKLIKKLRELGDPKDFNMRFLNNVILQSFGDDRTKLRQILRSDCRLIDKQKVAYRLSNAQINAMLRDGPPIRVAQLPTEEAEDLAKQLRQIGCKVSLLRK